jgi:ketosteroid isomerase-like protein
MTTRLNPTTVSTRPIQSRPTEAAAPTRPSTPSSNAPAVVDVMERPATQRTPEQVARQFYGAFVKRDYATMEQLYSPNVNFRDAIFAYPNRDGAMGMWRKILGDPSKPTENQFRYEFKRMEGDVAVGVWVADYKVFGRPVHNVIESRMTVRDGKIVDHQDSFDLAKWSRQALPVGGLSEFKPFQSVLKHVLRNVVG